MSRRAPAARQSKADALAQFIRLKSTSPQPPPPPHPGHTPHHHHTLALDPDDDTASLDVQDAASVASAPTAAASTTSVTTSTNTNMKSRRVHNLVRESELKKSNPSNVLRAAYVREILLASLEQQPFE